MVEKRKDIEMTTEEPYFLSNDEWYIFDEESFRYVLTDKANEKAKKSYEEFYDKLENKWQEIHSQVME